MVYTEKLGKLKIQLFKYSRPSLSKHWGTIPGLSFKSIPFTFLYPLVSAFPSGLIVQPQTIQELTHTKLVTSEKSDHSHQ